MRKCSFGGCIQKQLNLESLIADSSILEIIFRGRLYSETQPKCLKSIACKTYFRLHFSFQSNPNHTLYIALKSTRCHMRYGFLWASYRSRLESVIARSVIPLSRPIMYCLKMFKCRIRIVSFIPYRSTTLLLNQS